MSVCPSACSREGVYYKRFFSNHKTLLIKVLTNTSVVKRNAVRIRKEYKAMTIKVYEQNMEQPIQSINLSIY